MATVDDLVEDTGAYDCVECGKCTSVCPVAALNPDFAPRLIVVKALEGAEGLSQERDIWACITCEMCSDMCPYKVDYSGFIRGLRGEIAMQECNAGDKTDELRAVPPGRCHVRCVLDRRARGAELPALDLQK